MLVNAVSLLIDKEFSQEQLEKLFSSPDPFARGLAAWKEYKLNELVHDSNPYVRMCVIDKYFGLDLLINDECSAVVEHVQYRLEFVGLTLEEWIEKYPERCMSTSLFNCK